MNIYSRRFPALCFTAIILIALFVFLVFLGGCASVGPDYVRPDTGVSSQWHTPLKGGLNPAVMDSEVLASWWTTLNDRDLSGLIDRAVAGNLDVKKATARVRQARASRLAAKAGFFPAVEAAGSAVRNYSNADAVSDKVTDLYSANFDAVW
ncbi:MAG: TolC family protein, partial [Syntrophorhabdaceae bacterium]|nr:TolC family protein [Syntrophorhabdaceae bacterium]